MLEWLGAIASVATIFGAIVWWTSQQERDEDRSARRVELISKARQIILDESSDGTFEYGSDKLNDWAIRTLAQYGLPIEIDAPTVSLLFADLECAAFEIHADTVTVRNAFVRGSIFDLDANEIAIEDSYMSEVLVMSAYQATKDNVVRVQSSLLTDVKIAMWLDLAAKSLTERPFREVRHEVELTGSIARTFEVETIKGVLHFEGMIADTAPLLVSHSICEQQGQQGAVLECAPVNLPLQKIQDEWARRLSSWEWNFLYNPTARAPCPKRHSIPNTRRVPGS